MNKIKCPNCGEQFSIEEYFNEAIVKEIRDKEFSKELKEKEVQFQKELKLQLQ